MPASALPFSGFTFQVMRRQRNQITALSGIVAARQQARPSDKRPTLGATKITLRPLCGVTSASDKAREPDILSSCSSAA